MNLETRLREHCSNIDWERFATDKNYKEQIVNKTKNLQMEKAAQDCKPEEAEE
jgi:DNA repair ATPase RecN